MVKLPKIGKGLNYLKSDLVIYFENSFFYWTIIYVY